MAAKGGGPAFGGLGAGPGFAPPTQGLDSGVYGIGQALQNLPQTMDQAQLAQMQEQQKKQELAKQLLATIGTQYQANPNDQSLARRADQITREGGLSPITQRNATGVEAINPAALPGKDLNDLDKDSKEFFFGLPASVKAAYLKSHGIDPSRVDPSLLALGPTYALGSGQRTALLNDFSKEMASVADPKGAGPMGFLKWVQANKAGLEGIGMDTTSILNDPDFLTSLNSRALTETQDLASKGLLKVEDMEKYHAGLLQHYRDQLAERTSTDTKRLSIDQERADSEAAKNAAQVAKWSIDNRKTLEQIKEMPQKLQADLARVKAGGAQSFGYARLLLSNANTAKGQLASARSALSALNNIAQKYVAAYQPVPDDIKSQIQDLTTQVAPGGELESQINDAETQAREVVNNITSSVVGGKATPAKPPDPGAKPNLTLTRAEVIAIGKQTGDTPDQAIAKAKAKGITITQ